MNELEAINKNVKRVRSALGYSLVDDLAVIEVWGADATTFLHNRSTSNVRALEDGEGQPSTIVDRKAHLEAVFTLHKLGDRFYIVIDQAQAPELLRQLDGFRFREKVDFQDNTTEYSLTSVQGPLADSFLIRAQDKLAALPGDEHTICQRVLWGHRAILIRRTTTAESGFLVITPGSRFEEAILPEFDKQQAVCIGSEAAEVMRIEAGILRFGQDVSGQNLLPETGLELTSVSYDKGCFPGQEVLARIKTYGAPKQALVGLVFAQKQKLPAAVMNFQFTGGDTGTITSACYSPTLDRYIAMAYVAREHRVPDRKLSITHDGASFEVEVSLLPFVHGTNVREKAKELYNKALTEFTSASEEDAVQMLRQSIELDPLFADAYETLGVMISRQGNLDEAIALMKQLEALDPESVMAHANLSMFYMQQGDKDKAEEEKAIGLGIQMSKIAREMTSKKQDEEAKARKLEEAQSRLTMFKQVLEIDEHDLLANYGLGDANVQLGNFADAIPYLKKALQIKPSYTVAYLALAKAYENTGQLDDALATYERGVEVAARKGDFSPMNEMKLRLMALRPASSKQPVGADGQTN